jgi:hypothetical protein
MNESNENCANALPEAGLQATPRTKYAQAAGLDPNATGRFSAEFSPSMVLHANTDDYKAAGLTMRDKFRLEKYANSLAMVPEDAIVAPFSGAATAAASQPLDATAPNVLSSSTDGAAPIIQAATVTENPSEVSIMIAEMKRLRELTETLVLAGTLQAQDKQVDPSATKSTGLDAEMTEMMGEGLVSLQLDRAAEQKLLKSIATLNKWAKARKLYDLFMGGDFHNDSGTQIILRACRYSIDCVAKKASSRRSVLQAISSMVKQDVNKVVHFDAQRELEQILKLLSVKELKDMKNGSSSSNVSITFDDTKHIINCCMAREPNQFITTSKLELIQFQMIGQVTGKRVVERGTIAASSWKMTRHRRKDGATVRKMSFIHCYMKGYGIGMYDCSFMESVNMPLEANAIVITLVLLERKGMIKNALDVYEGREPLEIDGTVFETAEDLAAKLHQVEATAKPLMIAKLASSKVSTGRERQ